MSKINTDFMIGFNNIVTQLKQKKDKVSPEEWNSMWNIIATQTNQNAQFLQDLKKFVVGESVGDIEIPDNYSSIFEMLSQYTPPFHIGTIPPTDESVTMWFKIESSIEYPQEPVLPPSTVIQGGTFDEVPVNILSGGTFEETPIEVLQGGNY